MINDDFAKQDFSKGLNLEEFFASYDTKDTEEEESSVSLTDLLSQLLGAVFPPELAGHYVYKIIVHDRSYYPVDGTLKNTSIGLMFADALSREDGKEDTYITITDVRSAVFYWLPSAQAEQVEAQVSEFPTAA